MQCRICFDDGDTGTLVIPCRCRGTSSYIHRTCLEQYIRYYPDRICRVCHAPFIPFRTGLDVIYSLGVLAVLLCLIFVSNSRLLVKCAMVGLSCLVTAYFFTMSLFNRTPILFLGILLLLFLPGAHPAAVYMWLVVFGLLAFVYILSLHVPAIFILAMFVTLTMAAYVGFFTILAYRNLDAPAFSAYLGILYLSWYGWIHGREPFHARYRLA